MSTDVKIEMVSSADTSLYSRSASSKLVSSDNAPSSPPLTTKVLQIASGRRKGFEPKNDPDGEKRSERRVPSRVPKFENGEQKVATQTFDAVATDANESATDSNKSGSRANGSQIHRSDVKPTDPVETPLSPKLRSEYGANIIELNVSPLPSRKETTSPPPPNPLNPLPINPPVITNLSSSTRKKEESPRNQKEERPKDIAAKKESGRREIPKSETSGRRRSGSPVIEEVQEGSLPAGRRVSLTRSPPTSIKTRSNAPKETSQPRSRTDSKDRKDEKRPPEKAKSDERRRPEKDNRVDSRGRMRDDRSTPSNPQTIPANIHYDYKSVISQPELHGPDRHSSRRAKSGMSKSDERRPTTRESNQQSKPKARPKKDRSPTPPRKPHDDRPSIRVGGRLATSRDMFDSSGSISDPSSSSRQSESSTTETTSRRKIKTRSEALDKKLNDTFADGEFSPEDDSHLKFAIHTALEESRAKSVQEAIDAGHELNAEVLKSLHRPNAIEEVIETMVSQRRERIREKRESDRRQAKSPQTKKKVKTIQEPVEEKPVQKSKKVVVPAPAKKPSSTTVKTIVQVVDDDLDDEAEEDNRAPARRVKTKTGTKLVRKKIVKPVVVEDEADGDQAEEDSDEPLIETIEEVQDEPVKVAKPAAETVEIKKAAPKAKSKIMVDDGTPKTAELPGTPLLIPTLLKSEQTEEVEVVGAVKGSKGKAKQPKVADQSGGVAMGTFHVNEKGDAEYVVEEPVRVPRQPKVEEDGEVNVKLPRENRKTRKGDYLEKADELGNRDYVYDPLGVDQPFGDEDDSIGDDIYEESSEDDSKLTIAEKKDEMLYRFKLIKEGYPGIALPRITKKMKLAKMVRLYEHVMSRIKLKVKTNNFKIFLVIGFLAMQFAAKKFGADAAGFTINQMTSMKHYEKYLREIGESDFSSFGSDLPVMIRLPFFMAVNMGIFLIAKWIFKKTGKDYTTQFHKLYAQLTGGDDYVYIKEEGGTAGLDAGGGESEGGGGGIFGMIKSFLGMMGGANSDGAGEDKPKRGEATGPTYKRKRKPAAE